MRTNHVNCRGIIVWYFLGKTWKFYARALETWVYFVVLIKSNCYSSLPYLRWACLYRASLRFLPSDSLGLNHQKVGLGPSAAALDTMIWWVMELWRTATERSREMGWRDRPEQFPEHLVVRRVLNGTDEIPKEFQYSFQLRHCLDYCKFWMGPELMMPHGHSHINPFVFGSSFRILSKLFSHFEPLSSARNVEACSPKI